MSSPRITTSVERRAPTLSDHAVRIREVLGRDLPPALASLYGDTDGLTVTVARDGEPLDHFEGVIATLEDAFDGWKPHGQAADADEFADAGFDQAFCEITWSPDADVDADEALAQLNALRRSKLLMSIPGSPEFLVVDLDPPEGELQIGWAYEGCEYHPLDLDLDEFLRMVQMFGAARWFWAYLPPGVSHRNQVAEALRDFVDTWPAEVEALVRRASAGGVVPVDDDDEASQADEVEEVEEEEE